jgi:hypothetical protein
MPNHVLISRNQVAQMIYESTLYLLAVWSERVDAEIEQLNKPIHLRQTVLDAAG